jgi:hypothetical protein
MGGPCAGCRCRGTRKWAGIAIRGEGRCSFCTSAGQVVNPHDGLRSKHAFTVGAVAPFLKSSDISASEQRKCVACRRDGLGWLAICGHAGAVY